MIAGDLNVHNESWLCSTKTTPAGEHMEELSAFHGLHQHVTQPTRGENTLDLILSDFSETSVVVNVLDPIGASDHATVVATFNATPLREPPTKRRVWRYAQADWGRLRHFYSTANLDISEDPLASCRSVTAVVMEGMNRFIPHKEHSTKPTDPSWWTPDCSAATQAKKNAWNRLRRHPTCHQQLIDYNAKVRASANCFRLAKQAESVRIRDRLKHGSLRNKQWWSLLKQAASSDRSSSIPVLRNAQGREYVTNQEKATCFGEFFASKCSLGDQNLQHSDLPDLPPKCTSALTTVRFRKATVQRQLCQLDPTKATGPDGIPARVLKQCSKVLAAPLAKLFLLYFRCHVQPSLWKIARVIPILKKQSHSGAKNYRPVSLLSVVSKVMEKIVNTAIINHLEHKKALSIHLYGFRQGLSTSDLLTSLNHSWFSKVNRGGAVRVLAVDIAGAFDKVSHRGVLHKAASYGITGPLLNWLSDYLYDRKLQAVVGGASSEPYKIDAGVPQRSILGPTLCLLYVNDACDVLPEGITPAVYADDTTLYAHIPTPHAVTEVCRNLQAGVDALVEWGAQWRVTFEPTKSQAMTVSRHRRPWATPQIKLNGTAVPECSRLKLLGVTFDAHLTYSEHLRGTAVRATQRIGFFRKACHVLDPPGRATAYREFIRPLKEYNHVLPTCMDGSCGYPSLTAGLSPASCPHPDWDRGCNGHSVPEAPCGRPHNSVQAPLHRKPTSYCSDTPSQSHRTHHRVCHMSPLGCQPCARASTPDSPTCQIVQCCAAVFPGVPHRSLE